MRNSFYARGGFIHYADLLRAVIDKPGTSAQLAARVSRQTENTRKVLATMAQMLVVFPIAWVPRPRGGGLEPVWGPTGPAVPPPGTGRYVSMTGRCMSDVQTFCRIVLELRRCALSVDELSEAADCKRSLTPLMRHMAAIGLVFVEEWTRRITPGGAPVAHYRFGIDRASKRRPAPVPIHQVWAKHREAKKQRKQYVQLLFLTAGQQFGRHQLSHQERAS